MAVAINTSGTYKVVRVNNADSITGWALIKIEGAGGTPSVFASVGTIDLVKEGTDAVASIVNKQRVYVYHTTAAGFDFTASGSGAGSTKVPSGISYIWAAFLAAGSALTKANGGLQIALSDGTNTSYWNVAGSDTYSGGFIKWAILTSVTPSETSGTAADLGDITRVGFVCDVGGTTTRFDNMVIDAMEVGNGLTFIGTTTSNKMFLESQAQDDATKIGILSLANGIIFSQGSVLFSGTDMTSNGETLVFTDTIGDTYTYNFDVTGTITMTNSIVNGSGNVNYDFNTSGATAFTMNGGSLGGFNSLSTGSGQTMNGIVFQSGGGSTIPNTISNSSFNLCGLITLTGTLDGCTINSSTSSSSVITADLEDISNCTFISDGSNHAVELTSIGGGTMNWNNTLTSYVAAPATGATGNEAIYVNVGSGTLTINVLAGATTPSIRTAGASVNVVSGLVTTKVIVKDTAGAVIQNARVYLTTLSGGTLPADTVIFNSLTDVNGEVSDTRSFATDQPVDGWVRKSTISPLYKTSNLVGIIDSGAGLTINVQMIDDE